MFILISRSYLILNESTIKSNENIDDYHGGILVFDLKRDSGTPVQIDWLSKITISENDKNKKFFIICGCFSYTENYLALCDNNKNLVIFNRQFEIVNKFLINKNFVKMVFNKSEDLIFGCDKAGDIYEFAVNEKNTNNSGKLLLGHCSMLLDFIVTDDQKYIVSCDRDEKIRVTHYPNTYNIKTYCLGHTEFVSTIKLIDDTTIISGSGDGTIRLWDLLEGKLLFTYWFDENANEETDFSERKSKSEFPVKSLTIDHYNGNNLAVSFYNQPMIYLFKILRDSETYSSLQLTNKIHLESVPMELMFDLCQNNFLWIIGGYKDIPIQLYELKDNELSKAFSTIKVLDDLNENKILTENIVKEQQFNQVDNLFKHYYNNVEHYYRRKMLRKENEKKKSD